MDLIESSPYEDIFFSLKKVKYIDEIPLLDIYEVINDEDDDWERFNRSQTELNNFLSTKASYWKHENEYRLIMRKTPSFDVGEDHYEEMGTGIKAIYLGNKLEPEKARRFVEIARRKCIDVYYMLPDEIKYGLKAIKISDNLNVILEPK